MSERCNICGKQLDFDDMEVDRCHSCRRKIGAKVSGSEKKMKHVGWVVQNRQGSHHWDTASRTREQVIASVDSFPGERGNYKIMKKANIYRCVKLYVEAQNE